MSAVTESSRAGAYWAWVPVGLLASMFAGLGTLAAIAVDDPHFALEPDYYAKAVHWDQTQTQERENEALGFELAFAKPLVVEANGRVEVELALKDRARAGISGASVEIAAFPNAFAARVEQLVLREVAPGVYRGELLHGLPGLWELRCTVKAGSARYVRALRGDVSKSGAA